MKRPRVRHVAIILIGLCATGCDHAPSFNLLGSYFPAWMVCLPVAILLTIALRFLVQRFRLEDYLRPVFISYFAAWAFFTFSLWLLFFS
jgi:YtcA family